MQNYTPNSNEFTTFGSKQKSDEIKDLMLKEIFNILPRIDKESFLVKILEGGNKYEIIGLNYEAIHAYLKALDELKDHDANGKECIVFDTHNTRIYENMTIREFKQHIDKKTFNLIHRAGYNDFNFDNAIKVANSILETIKSHSDNTNVTNQVSPTRVLEPQEKTSNAIEISNPATNSSQRFPNPHYRNPQFSPISSINTINLPHQSEPNKLDDQVSYPALLPIPKKLKIGERNEDDLTEKHPVIFNAQISDQVMDNASSDIASSNQHSSIDTDYHSDDSFDIPPPPPRPNIAGGLP